MLNEYAWNATCDLDAVLRPCSPLISTMESTNRVTSSLVLPMTYAVLHATSSDVPVQRYEYVKNELTDEDLKAEQELACEVQEVRRMLYKENKRSFVDEERVGHKEDLLISNILDPRFKLILGIGIGICIVSVYRFTLSKSIDRSVCSIPPIDIIGLLQANIGIGIDIIRYYGYRYRHRIGLSD